MSIIQENMMPWFYNHKTNHTLFWIRKTQNIILTYTDTHLSVAKFNFSGILYKMRNLQSVSL